MEQKNKSVLVDCLFGKEFFSLGPRAQAIKTTQSWGSVLHCSVFYCQHNLNHLRVCFFSFFPNE